MQKQVIQEFEEKGLGPLFTALANDEINSEEFVRRLEQLENRPVLSAGRMVRRILVSALPFIFDDKK